MDTIKIKFAIFYFVIFSLLNCEGNKGNFDGSEEGFKLKPGNVNIFDFKANIKLKKKPQAKIEIDDELKNQNNTPIFLEDNDPDHDGVLSDGDKSGQVGDKPCQAKGQKECCYTSSDCDDHDPSTIDTCLSYKDGEAYYQCEHKLDNDYCNASKNSDCDDGKLCTIDACCADGSVIGGDQAVNCQDKPDNRCVHLKKPNCCENNNDCMLSYIEENGKNNFFMLHICCGGDGIDILGNEETACSGKEKNSCVHVFSKDYCDSATDCIPNPVGKKCFTAYCIAHRCRYGLPKSVGCCEKDSDCDDKNICTVDKCENITNGVGTCVNIKDDTKPNCCNSTVPDCCNDSPDCDPDTETCCQEGCTKTVCQYNAQAGYKTCKSIDLKQFGLCCESNNDCDDNNVCTADVCSNNSCRHVKVSDDCCKTKFQCAKTGDQCAKVKCESNTCDLEDNAGDCTANIPYVQKFDMNKTFYNDYTKLETIAFSHFDLGSGDTSQNWSFSNQGSYMGPDKYLRFNGGNLNQGFLSCVKLPKLNAKGKTQVTVRLQYNVVTNNDLNGIFIKIYAKKGDETWDDALKVVVADNIKQDLSPADETFVIPKQKLGYILDVALCVGGDTGGNLSYVGFDNIKVVSGSAPIWLTQIDDLTLKAGESWVISDFKVKDSDGNNLKVYLLNAPSFVSVQNFFFTKENGITKGIGNIQIVEAKCKADGTPYTIKAVVDDGYLVGTEEFTLTVTNCQ